MVQTNNQPQAVDFGSIFPSVAVSAYGARNRRQRGIYNIDFLSANRPKINQGPNVGRNVIGVRGSAGNVLGTSAHSRLIDNVTFSTQKLARATASATAADTVKSTADTARSNGNGDLFTDLAITALNLAQSDMVGFLNVSSGSSVYDKAKNYDDSVTDTPAVVELTRLYNLYDGFGTLANDATIASIKNYNKNIQTGLTDVNALLGLISSSEPIPINVDAANTATEKAITVEANYTKASAHEIATNNAQTAAQAELATANSRLY
jgi:hypothetical protein